MKHLKTYEGEFLDNLDKKSAEYEGYAGKSIIFDYKGNLFLGKFLRIILNGYFAKLILKGK